MCEFNTTQIRDEMRIECREWKGEGKYYYKGIEHYLRAIEAQYPFPDSEMDNFEHCYDFMQEEAPLKYTKDDDDEKDDDDGTEGEGKPKKRQQMFTMSELKMIVEFAQMLLAKDQEMVDVLNAYMSNRMLWFMYIYYNHVLYCSRRDELGELAKSDMLINTFVARGKGMTHALLRLAITGAKLSNYYNSMRDDHDEIYPNLYVVKALVSMHVSPYADIHEPLIVDISDITSDNDESIRAEYAAAIADANAPVTPLEYARNFKRITTSMSCWGSNERIIKYEVDKEIVSYLEQWKE
jgi:hypothetical protein